MVKQDTSNIPIRVQILNKNHANYILALPSAITSKLIHVSITPLTSFTTLLSLFVNIHHYEEISFEYRRL